MPQFYRLKSGKSPALDRRGWVDMKIIHSLKTDHLHPPRIIFTTRPSVVSFCGMVIKRTLHDSQHDPGISPGHEVYLFFSNPRRHESLDEIAECCDIIGQPHVA